MDCIFCKIINREIPAEIVYEDENVLAFLDIRPTTTGHTLVIPKRHTETLLESGEDTLSQMLPAIKKVALGVLAATKALGFNLGCNTGEAAGQIVFHLHFHIIPRYENDGLVPWQHRDSDERSRRELAEEIKKHISP